MERFVAAQHQHRRVRRRRYNILPGSYVRNAFTRSGIGKQTTSSARMAAPVDLGPGTSRTGKTGAVAVPGTPAVLLPLHLLVRAVKFTAVAR